MLLSLKHEFNLHVHYFFNNIEDITNCTLELFIFFHTGLFPLGIMQM